MYHLLQIMIMSHLHFFGDIPACSPSIRSRLHFRTCPTSRDGLFVSYHIYPDSRTSFSSFFTMYIMHISFYIGQWPCYHQHLFPTLNRHLYPVPKYGTNQKAYDRTTLILPTPLLMLYTFPHLTSLKKKPSWMSCWNPIFQNHINMLLLRHLIPFQILRSFLPRHRHLRSASRKPKQLPKHQSNVVATTSSRDSGPLAP